jgi:hypothetical protein
VHLPEGMEPRARDPEPVLDWMEFFFDDVLGAVRFAEAVKEEGSGGWGAPEEFKEALRDWKSCFTDCSFTGLDFTAPRGLFDTEDSPFKVYVFCPKAHDLAGTQTAVGRQQST